MVIVPKAGDLFGKQDPAYGLLWHAPDGAKCKGEIAGSNRNPKSKMESVLSRITEDTVFIIGAGHFGARAARIICRQSESPVVVVDPDEKSLSNLKDLRARKILGDGIQFLIRNFQYLKHVNTIVPALPVHLAYEWLTLFPEEGIRMRKIAVPQIKPRVPHSWPASDGSTLVSYADFLCPDDCPEPSSCTVTGERREQPLYALLSGLNLPPFNIHIIRSRQLAPGLGGYKVEDLKNAAEKVLENKNRMWILGTACKCHGILTAFEMNREVQ